jgi:hypothetical protein
MLHPETAPKAQFPQQHPRAVVATSMATSMAANMVAANDGPLPELTAPHVQTRPPQGAVNGGVRSCCTGIYSFKEGHTDKYESASCNRQLRHVQLGKLNDNTISHEYTKVLLFSSSCVA